MVRIISFNIRILMRNEEFVEPGHNLPPGPYISLIVEDDGKGMDEKTKDRIFEPFFTTKFHGRGLGMAAVYGIVRNHDGWLSVDSKPGLGTAVYVNLPVIKDPDGAKRHRWKQISADEVR